MGRRKGLPPNKVDQDKGDRIFKVLDSLKTKQNIPIKVENTTLNQEKISEPRGSWWPFKK